MNKRIYLSPPHLSGQERDFISAALDSNWIAPLGPMVDAFEEEIGAYIGVKYATALSSGTASLHLAVLISGVQEGDVVVCPTLTFSATANVIAYAGARPVFVDCDRETWTLDPVLLEEALSSRCSSGRTPAAVIAVDLYGQCADYDRIEQVCQVYGVPLIEDAAEALGATYGGKRAGSFGKMAVFSFNGNKIITTSGGGMLVSREKALIDRARFLSTQARDPAPHYQHSTIGYNYRMSNLLAAVGRGQLKVIDERISARRRVFNNYRAALRECRGLTFMPEANYGTGNRWLTCILIDPKEFGATREDVRLALEGQDIESRPIWKPMHMQPVFKDCSIRGGKVAEEIFTNGLCLPSGSGLAPGDQQRVTDVILRFAKG